MKKNGFTLLELIAVIVIIGIMGTFITVNLVQSLRDANQQACDEFIKRIEDGACVYTSLHECDRSLGCSITLGELISEGYVKEDKNVCTEKNLDDYGSDNIKITFVDGEKKCHYEGQRTYSK